MRPPRPPPLSDPRAVAARAIAGCAGLATVSAWIMLVLGGLSLAVSLTNPLSPGFAISVAVLINGWLERRFARQLVAHDPRAPRRLALNQVALGLEIAAYAFWQVKLIGPEQIDQVLQRPFVARSIAAVDPAVAERLLHTLPEFVRMGYWMVGAGACLGCMATAWYYASRVRALRVLAASPHQ